jgi:phenylacetate-CoA ligase
MRGYPSGIETLAKYITLNSIKLKFELKGIYLTSEFFDSSVSEFIRTSFNCPVFGQYGHSEVSVFAFTYANSLEYICSPLYGYTEVIDEDGNQVKEGEKGEVVVTGFSNKVMPFIRYKTGDIATYGGNRNGVVKLLSLEGRSVDFIVNKDNKKVYVIGLIFGGHLKSFANISSWQIEQNRVGNITVKIVKGDGFFEEHEKEITRLFESVGVSSVLEFVSSIPLSTRGKRKFLIQNLN